MQLKTWSGESGSGLGARPVWIGGSVYSPQLNITKTEIRFVFLFVFYLVILNWLLE